MTTTTFFSVEVTVFDDEPISEELIESILSKAPEFEDAVIIVTEED